MFPDRFDYRRAETVAEARAVLAEHEDAALLAGGHSLIPALKAGTATPDTVVDVSTVDALTGVTVTDDAVRVGAATTYADALASDAVRRAAPSVHEALGAIGDRQVRNRGTVGGNLAQAAPAADLPGAVLAADARVVVAGPDGERLIPAADLVHGPRETALGPTDVLVALELPTRERTGDVRGTYAKRSGHTSGWALVGVAVRLAVREGTVREPRVGVSAALDRPTRLEPVEDTLRGAAVTDALPGRAGDAALEGVDRARLRGDEDASPEFRAALLETYVERAVETVLAAEPAAAD